MIPLAVVAAAVPVVTSAAQVLSTLCLIVIAICAIGIVYMVVIATSHDRLDRLDFKKWQAEQEKRRSGGGPPSV
jgi:hypothetical protein